MKISLYNHVHLGDTINNLQRYYRQATEVYMPKTCKCCSTNLLAMLQFLITLMPTELKISDNPDDSIQVMPSWTQQIPNRFGVNQWYREPYVKAKHLPSVRGHHIACQFDARTKKYPSAQDNY